ncbi:MAG TPA: aspartate kinase [Planctomycetota bacterium]
MKFGGSSLATADRLRQVADLVEAAQGRKPCVVLSAMGKTTNALFSAAAAAHNGAIDSALANVTVIFENAASVAEELLPDIGGPLHGQCRSALAQMQAELEVLLRGVSLLRELTPRTSDAIVAHGEHIAATLFTAFLAQRSMAAVHVDARVVVRTDGNFGAASPMRDQIAKLAQEHIAPAIARGAIVVMQGYVGATEQGFTTTLGRGGSDWSAALLGEALRAEEVQIWTDVEGVLTADPRIVPHARPVAVLTAAEAAELAAFGAKVLHPATIQPAVEAGVPVTVRHTLRPRGAFTTIDPRKKSLARNGVAALACRGPVTVLTMTSTRMLAATGYLARLFAAFGQLGICIDLVVTAEVSVACTVEPDAPIDRLVAALAGLARVDVTHQCGIVVLVGEGLRNSPRALERASRALGPIVPELVSFGGNERNLSFVVRHEDMATAMQRLHAEFFGEAGAGRPEEASRREAPSTPARTFEAS